MRFTIKLNTMHQYNEIDALLSWYRCDYDKKNKLYTIYVQDLEALQKVLNMLDRFVVIDKDFNIYFM